MLILIIVLLHNYQSYKVIPEVDEDVNNEHDIHYEVHNIERRAGVYTTLQDWIFLRRQRGQRGRVKGRL